jgi:hypothetical protein
MFVVGVASAIGLPATRPAALASASDTRVAEVSDAVRGKGWFTEPGAGVPSATLERVADRLHAAGASWGLVALAEAPAGGTKFFAADLLDALRGDEADVSTVVVLTPTDIAAESRTYGVDQVEPALTDAVPSFDRDVVAGYEHLFLSLAGAPLTAQVGNAAGRGGAGKLPAVVAGASLLVAAVLLLALRRGSRRS